MKLRYEQFLKHIEKNLNSIYCIFGQEPLLINECADVIRRKSKNNGFNERLRYHADATFDWETLLSSSQNLSLFSDKKLIEIHLTQSKLSESASRILMTYCENPPPDTLLILICEQLETQQQNTRWFKCLTEDGVTIQLWPLDKPKLKAWINQRLAKCSLILEPSAIDILIDHTQGNLLATQQEIEKLHLLFNEGTLSTEQVQQSLADNARFNLFEFVDTVLTGDLSNINRVLNRLQHEATEPVLILWALTRELRTLIQIKEALFNKTSLESLWQKYRIWPARQRQVKSVLERVSIGTLYRLLYKAQHIDTIIKGINPGNIWEVLSQYCLGFTNATSWEPRYHEQTP